MGATDVALPPLHAMKYINVAPGPGKKPRAFCRAPRGPKGGRVGRAPRLQGVVVVEVGRVFERFSECKKRVQKCCDKLYLVCVP
jgi:hypothetical protein